MEKNCNNSLKDHKIGSKFNNDQNSGNYKMKDSLNYYKCNTQQQQQSCFGEEYLSGLLWPPRSYACSFCKREFRSAQALGGHMNVHRRDRARLRMSPPPPRDNNNNNNNNDQYPFLNLNHNPNPNPSPNPNRNFNSTPPLVSPYSTSFSSQSPASPSGMSKWGIGGRLRDALSLKDSVEKSSKSFIGTEELDGCKNLTKKAEVVRLDLEIGLISDSKEDLDLELRLGYS